MLRAGADQVAMVEPKQWARLENKGKDWIYFERGKPYPLYPRFPAQLMSSGNNRPPDK